MMWANKLLKFILLTGFRLATAIVLYFLALLTASPIVLSALCIFDLIGKIPLLLSGRYLICWLIVSVPFWIGYNLYTDIKARLPKNKKNK